MGWEPPLGKHITEVLAFIRLLIHPFMQQILY